MTQGHSMRTLGLHTEFDVGKVRVCVREAADALGFDETSRTKLVTAASELARNALVHGGGGDVVLQEVAGPAPGHSAGLQLTFRDQGPGIADLDQALTPGWSSGSGLGLGLSGSRRLVHDFRIESAPGAGTQIVVTMWVRR